jgi:hypothetical protein
MTFGVNASRRILTALEGGLVESALLLGELRGDLLRDADLAFSHPLELLVDDRRVGLGNELRRRPRRAA